MEIRYGEVTIRQEHMPSDDERDALALRRALLVERTQGTADERAMAMVMALRLVLPFQGKGDPEAEAFAGAFYRQALDDLPAVAICRTVERINRGELGKLRFMPSPAEMRQLVQHVMAPYLAELYEIDAVLRAEAIRERSPKDRERVAGLMHALAKSMAPAKLGVTPDQELAMLPEDPVSVSAALLGKISGRPEG